MRGSENMQVCMCVWGMCDGVLCGRFSYLKKSRRDTKDSVSFQ